MRFLVFISFCLTVFSATQDLNGANNGPKINWLTNYEDAVNQSKATSKPLLLFFTGSDWCGWCNKLEDEALDTLAFQNEAGEKFIFVKLDFPLYKSLDAQTNAQNKQLQKRYDIRSYPTIVLLDSNQQKIGTTGYKPGGGRAYATHLLKMVDDYQSYKTQTKSLDTKQFSGVDLKKLYEKSRELNFGNDTNKIIKAGIESDYAHFFKTEKYRSLVAEGLIKDPETIALRQDILAEDPRNELHTHYDVAVIDFESYCEKFENENDLPQLAVAPLVDYIKKFGDKDKENLWRLEIIISQVYLDKNRFKDALEHAQISHESAPSTVRPDIALAIKSIELKLDAPVTP